MVTKIVAQLRGGIGNQLFIYAAARRLSLATRSELVLDSRTGFQKDTLYNRFYQLGNFSIPCRLADSSELLYPIRCIRYPLMRLVDSFLPYSAKRFIRQSSEHFDPRILKLAPRHKLYLEGYWQSEQYFSDVVPQLRKELLIRPPSDSQNRFFARAIKAQRSVAVHIRNFDSVHERSHDSSPGNNLHTSYYRRAVDFMEDKYPGSHYFVFSDSPNDANAIMSGIANNYTVIDCNRGDSLAYADLWLMSLCDHFIIANSTFSWWGAWLSNCVNKQVVAPSVVTNHGSSFWGFDGLIPSDWILL